VKKLATNEGLVELHGRRDAVRTTARINEIFSVLLNLDLLIVSIGLRHCLRFVIARRVDTCPIGSQLWMSCIDQSGQPASYPQASKADLSMIPRARHLADWAGNLGSIDPSLESSSTKMPSLRCVARKTRPASKVARPISVSKVK